MTVRYIFRWQNPEWRNQQPTREGERASAPLSSRDHDASSLMLRRNKFWVYFYGFDVKWDRDSYTLSKILEKNKNVFFN